MLRQRRAYAGKPVQVRAQWRGGSLPRRGEWLIAELPLQKAKSTPQWVVSGWAVMRQSRQAADFIRIPRIYFSLDADASFVSLMCEV